MADIVIGIPTFKRPELLQKLLSSLVNEINQSVWLVVADNGCSDDTKAVVTAFAADFPRCFYVPIPERGLAPVRNGLVSAVTDLVPDWRWLAMLDDDGYVSEGWLARIVACSETYDAHLTGGPVEGVLPEGANILARNSIFARRRRWKTGLVDSLNTTQNLLISRKLLTLAPAPLFRNEYSASGGEDYDLFRRVRQSGGRIAWCDEAVVFEPTPENRLSHGSVLSRYYTTGIYMSQIDRFYDGPRKTYTTAFKGFASSLLRTIGAGFRRDRNAVAQGMLSTAHYAGRAVGLLGGSTARYT